MRESRTYRKGDGRQEIGGGRLESRKEDFRRKGDSSIEEAKGENGRFMKKGCDG